MPSTTVVIPEEQSLDSLDQWAELITAAGGAATKYMEKGSARKSLKVQKKITEQEAKAQEAAARAASVQQYTPPSTPWIQYVLLGVGILAVGGLIIFLVKK